MLVDAGMAAGFRLAKPSLGQLHQALVHLYRQHPDAAVAVLGDPALKWDVATAEGPMFEGDIIAGAIVCAPAGALDGTAGFLARAAAKARAQGYEVVAFTDRAIPDVVPRPAPQRRRSLDVGPRCHAHAGRRPGRTTARLEPSASPHPLIVRHASAILLLAFGLAAGAGPASAQDPGTSSTTVAVPSQEIVPQPNSGSAPQEAGDRGGALQLGLLALLVVVIGARSSCSCASRVAARNVE